MFSKCNQAVDIIRMIIDKLVELRFETTMEKADSISIVKVSQAAPVPLQQGNVLIDRTFLAQVSDQIESVFVIKWGCCFIQSQTEE